MRKWMLLGVAVFAILTAAYFIIVDKGLSVIDQGFSCSSDGCGYRVRIENKDTQDFNGFLHVFGYKKSGEKRSLITEKYMEVKVSAGLEKEFYMSSGLKQKPDEIEYTLRSGIHFGWLGSCELGMYKIDFNKLTISLNSVTKFENRPWVHTSQKGTIKEALDKKFEVNFEGSAESMFIKPESDFFRVRMFSSSGKYMGYAKACELSELQELLGFINAKESPTR